MSCNFGVEGPTDDPEVESLRSRQVKNFLVLTLFALGAPMILMGDEVRRTKKDNNNEFKLPPHALAVVFARAPAGAV